MAGEIVQMAALFYSPETVREDEQAIAKGYRAGWALSSAAILAVVGAAYYGDTQTVLAVGFGGLFVSVNDAGSRLYDLCIRLRRTNQILSERTGQPRKTRPL
jgi:hypothetical protein